MNRPILIALIGYIIGILWGLYFKISVVLLFIVLWSMYFILKKNKYIKIFMKSKILILVTACAIISNIIVINLNNNYENKYKNIDKNKFEAIVVSSKKLKKYHVEYKVKILSVDKNTYFKGTHILLKVSTKNKQILKYGDKIEFIAEFTKPTKQRNYGGFDYSSYLKSIGLYGTAKTENVKVIQQNKGNIIARLCSNIANKIEEIIFKVIPNKDNRNLLLGILLGNDDALDKQVKGYFKDSSLSHIMAVSGMHVSYVILAVSIILAKTNISKNGAKILTIFVIIFFMFLTNFSPSVVRAGIMGSLVLGSSILYRKNDIATSMSIALFFILINNPFSIMDIGLILSFFGTIGIVLLNKNILNLFNTKDTKALKLNKSNIFQKMLIKIKEAISVSISAQIFILPCTMLLFNTVSTTFLFSNLLVSFIIGSVIILGFITIIVSIKFIFLGEILGLIVNCLLEILIIISKFFSKIPFTKLIVKTPDISFILIYYITIIFISYVYYLKKKEKIRYTQKKLLTFVENVRSTVVKNKKMLISIILIFIIINTVYRAIPTDLLIHFIDVGQGDSCLVITPQKNTILIDGGGSRDTDEFDVGESTLLPYLLDRKINKIDYIVISHFDADHARFYPIFVTRNKSEKCYYRKAI